MKYYKSKPNITKNYTKCISTNNKLQKITKNNDKNYKLKKIFKNNNVKRKFIKNKTNF